MKARWGADVLARKKRAWAKTQCHLSFSSTTARQQVVWLEVLEFNNIIIYL